MNKKEKAMRQDMLKEMFSAAFGVDMDDDVDFNNLSSLGEKMRQKFAEENHQQQQANFSNSKHKTYTGVNKKLAEKAALLQKSWKALYFKLVKRLHPDKEPDEEKRLYKTEVMQRITLAYEKNDFYTLLHIYQHEVGFNNEEKEDELNNDDILGEYIAILKKQEAEVKDKISNIEFEAANNGMPFLADKNADIYYKTFVNGRRKELSGGILSIKEDIRAFSNIDNFKSILKTIRKEELELADEFDFFDDDSDGPLFEPVKKRKHF